MPRAKMKVAWLPYRDEFQAFCVIRSYVDAMEKQVRMMFAALFSVFDGHPWSRMAADQLPFD